MPAALIEIFVFVAEMAARCGPGLLEVGANLIKAIESHGDYTDEQKAALVARVKAARQKVADYTPRDLTK